MCVLCIERGDVNSAIKLQLKGLFIAKPPPRSKLISLAGDALRWVIFTFTPAGF